MEKKSNSNVSQMPKTGRIGRFVKILQPQIEENIFQDIINNAENYEVLNKEGKSAFWKNAIEKMENRLGQKKQPK